MKIVAETLCNCWSCFGESPSFFHSIERSKQSQKTIDPRSNPPIKTKLVCKMGVVVGTSKMENKEK